MIKHMFVRLQKIFYKYILAKVYAIGNRVECNFCGWTGFAFLPAGSPQQANRLCPKCFSLQRYRLLRFYLQENGMGKITEPFRLLEVAPNPVFQKFCKSIPNVTYVSADLETQNAMLLSDLTKMGIKDDAFDIIVCFHVLEHIPDDKAAMKEIGRLLKPDGFGLLMVPIDREKTFYDPNVSPEDYERVYGQRDHVRRCGMDYEKYMIDVGLNVEMVDVFQYIPDIVLTRYALRGDDRYLFRVSKSRHLMQEL